jgi:hypothetical protein
VIHVAGALVLFVGTATEGAAPPDVRDSLAGRSGALKARLLKKYGGNEHSEKAVALALDWLARQQQADGSWSLSSLDVDRPAVGTAMALLAFLGSGTTHSAGEHKTAVARGIEWLTASQQSDGSWRGIDTSDRAYSHAFALSAVCEAYGMTKDPKLRAPAERAVQYGLDNQCPLGGWGYTADLPGDVSVTGFVFMGLQSARMAGLKVPQRNLDRVVGFLDKCTKDGSRYSYVAHQGSAWPAMTAEALLCRQYLGWKPDKEEMRNGVEYLLKEEHLPSWRPHDVNGAGRDAYFWYFATQLMFQIEGKPWEKWNGTIRDLLVKNQITSGRERGSWNPIGDRFGSDGAGPARLYVTCMHTYILQVYYRHLPLFSMRP